MFFSGHGCTCSLEDIGRIIVIDTFIIIIINIHTIVCSFVIVYNFIIILILTWVNTIIIRAINIPALITIITLIIESYHHLYP